MPATRTSTFDIRILCGATKVNLIFEGVGPSVGPTSTAPYFFRKSAGKDGSLLVRAATRLANSALLVATSPSQATALDDRCLTRVEQDDSSLLLRASMIAASNVSLRRSTPALRGPASKRYCWAHSMLSASMHTA